MKNVLTVLIVLVTLALVGGLVLAQSGNDLFQQALVKERAGKYQEAIKLYQTIVQKNSSDHKLAAKALFQMGQAYEKLGNVEARKTYERITRDFADQKDVASNAGLRLAALSTLPNPDKPGPRLVMTGNDVDSSASISDDGRWMAMTEWSTADGDLVVRELATGQVKRLQAGTCGTGSKNCTFGEVPIFSPDNRQVAYTWYDKTDNKGLGQLRIIANETGAKPRVLVRNPEFNIWANGWSPDGKSIFVQIRKPDRTWQIGRVSVADGSITVLKSLEWRFQPQRSKLSLSPDGRFILYSALAVNPPTPAPSDLDSYIYAIGVEGGSETVLTKTAAINESPVWTPDGSHILFLSNRSGSFDLWSVPLRNGNSLGSPSLVKMDIGRVSAIGMTRAGSYMYYRVTDSVDQFSIAEIPSITGKTQGATIRIMQNIVGKDPAWSPDGKSLAFKRHLANGKDAVVINSLETGEERLSTHDGYASAYRLQWFHDGKSFLAWVAPPLAQLPQNSIRLVYRVDSATKEWKEALSLDIASLQPASLLSPDDKILYKAAIEPTPNNRLMRWDSIVAFDLATGQKKRVFTLPGAFGENFAVSPDGLTLAMTVAADLVTDQVRVAQVGVNGTNYRELSPPQKLNPTFLQWTQDGRTILSEQLKDDGTSQLMRIPADGGKTEFTGISIPEGFLAMSPDGSHVAFNNAGGKINEILAFDNLPSLLKNSQ